jgi:hypothetical protein
MAFIVTDLAWAETTPRSGTNRHEQNDGLTPRIAAWFEPASPHSPSLPGPDKYRHVFQFGSGTTTVSETHFTKLDWRPGNRRKTVPRVRCYGGQKEAPVGLIAARKLVGLHTNRAARCTATALSTGRKCRHVAVTGANVCMLHGGTFALKRNRPYVRTAHGQRIQAEIAAGGKPNWRAD